LVASIYFLIKVVVTYILDLGGGEVGFAEVLRTVPRPVAHTAHHHHDPWLPLPRSIIITADGDDDAVGGADDGVDYESDDPKRQQERAAAKQQSPADGPID
jgi:hypothetical protein